MKKLFKTSKNKKIAYIILDEHTKKWIISNINGWKATSLFDSIKIVDMKCSRKKKGKKIIWIVYYMDYPSFKFTVINNTVEVRYILKNGDEKMINFGLSIRTYCLEKLGDDDFDYDDRNELIIYSAKYRNLIGEYLFKTDNQVTILLHSFLSHLAHNKDGKIYPLKTYCYKLISQFEEQNYDIQSEEVGLLTSGISELYLNEN